MIEYNLHHNFFLPFSKLGFGRLSSSCTYSQLVNDPDLIGIFAVNTSNSLRLVQIRDSGDVEEDVPFKNTVPNVMDLRTRQNGKKDIILGYIDGRLYAFDPYARKAADMRKHNLLEGPEAKKQIPIKMLRWVPPDEKLFIVVFEDCSMHFINNEVENCRNNDLSFINMIITKMREIEKTRVYNEGRGIYKGEKIEIICEIVNINFCLNIQGNSILDFSYVDNLNSNFNPKSIWQFYYKEIYDIRFCPVRSQTGQIMFALCASDKYLRIFNYTNPEIITAIENFYGSFYSCQFSQDGRLLAAGGEDNSIMLFETENFCSIARLMGHRSPAIGLRFDLRFFKTYNSRNYDYGVDYLANETSAHPDDYFNEMKSTDIAALVKHKKAIDGNEMINNLYRLVSFGKDCRAIFWNIDFNEINHITYLRKLKRPNLFESKLDQIRRLPPKFCIVLLTPAEKIKLTDFPTEIGEIVNSYLIVGSKSLNIRVFRPRYVGYIERFIQDNCPMVNEETNNADLDAFNQFNNIDFNFNPDPEKKFENLIIEDLKEIEEETKENQPPKKYDFFSELAQFQEEREEKKEEIPRRTPVWRQIINKKKAKKKRNKKVIKEFFKIKINKDHIHIHGDNHLCKYCELKLKYLNDKMNKGPFPYLKEKPERISKITNDRKEEQYYFIDPDFDKKFSFKELLKKEYQLAKEKEDPEIPRKEKKDNFKFKYNLIKDDIFFEQIEEPDLIPNYRIHSINKDDLKKIKITTNDFENELLTRKKSSHNQKVKNPNLDDNTIVFPEIKINIIPSSNQNSKKLDSNNKEFLDSGKYFEDNIQVNHNPSSQAEISKKLKKYNSEVNLFETPMKISQESSSKLKIKENASINSIHLPNIKNKSSNNDPNIDECIENLILKNNKSPNSNLNIRYLKNKDNGINSIKKFRRKSLEI